MDRWHPPRGRNFTTGTEVLADYALHTPVVDERAVNYCDYHNNYPEYHYPHSAGITLNNWRITEFAKHVTDRQAATEIFIANLGTLNRLPTAL